MKIVLLEAYYTYKLKMSKEICWSFREENQNDSWKSISTLYFQNFTIRINHNFDIKIFDISNIEKILQIRIYLFFKNTNMYNI